MKLLILILMMPFMVFAAEPDLIDKMMGWIDMSMKNVMIVGILKFPVTCG